MAALYRIGIDENGLGARLGPLVVTAVMAEVDAAGLRTLSRRLPKRIRRDLDDSKKLVSHSDFVLGEAWARALVSEPVGSPRELLERMCLESGAELRAPCPEHVMDQCWSVDSEIFAAKDELLARVRRHLDELRERGVHILSVRSSIRCTKLLNHAKRKGGNRFVSDLHSMERLVLELHGQARSNVHAVCGKVGGMTAYSKFFGPLGGWLHAVVQQSAAVSAYRFPGLGDIEFVRDADGRDPLVMLASLAGKYLRELLMARVARYYLGADSDQPRPSGYHDPVTARFVRASAVLRKRRRVPGECFERERDADQVMLPAKNPPALGPGYKTS